MYKANAYIDIRTPITSGEGPAFFKMFEKEVTLDLAIKDFIIWAENGFLPAYEEMPNLRPGQVKQLDEHTFEFRAHMIISKAHDSLAYYQELTQNGWKANDEEDDVIRERGYSNFKPKEFVKA